MRIASITMNMSRLTGLYGNIARDMNHRAHAGMKPPMQLRVAVITIGV